MSLTILGLVFTAVGDIVIAYMVLSVHSHIMREKKVDKHIFLYMKKEQAVAAVGILFVLIGLVLTIIGELQSV